MRRTPVVVVGAVLAVVTLPGCGGSDKATLPPALDAALKYLPEDAAVLAVVPTDTDAGPLKQLDELASERVGGWDRVKSRLRRQLSRNGVLAANTDALFGNPLAVAQAGPNSDDQYLAINVGDATVVKQAAEDAVAKGRAHTLPEYKGAFVWMKTDDSKDDSPKFNALKGDVLVSAASEQLLKQVIDRAEGSDNMASNGGFTQRLDELGDASLTRIVGDAQRLLDNADQNAAGARKVKFVKSLGMFYGKTQVTADGLRSDSTLKTDKEDLSDSERPLPESSAKLTVPTADVLVAGALLDPDHLVKFAEATAKQASPGSFGQYELGLEQLKSTAGIDLHADLLAHITQLSVAFTGRDQIEFQAKLDDGQAFQESLTRAQTFLQGVLGSAVGENTTLSIEGGGAEPVYVVKRARREVARFAVRDDSLVGSVGPRGNLPSPTVSEPIGGSDGALGIVADLTRVNSLPGVGDKVDDPLARDLLGSLGTLHTSINETQDEITENSVLVLG